MRTAMQDTSLEAYFKIVVPDLGARQKAVLKVFTDNQAMNFTNLEIARDLRWDINRVTPRVYELRGKGKNNPMTENPVLMESERRPCRESGHKAIAWQLNPYWSPGGYKID
jgi:hypothetical protein